MRHIVNERKFKVARAIATGASVSGVILLIASLVLPILRSDVFFGPPSLFVITGLALSLIGIRMANKWLRPPLAHHSLGDGLRGLGKQAVAYHYYLPARHVLVCQHGVFTLTVVPIRVTASVNKDRWRRRENILRRLVALFRQESLSDPTIVATLDAARLQRWLDRRIPGHNVTVQPVVVFTNERAYVEIGKVSVPVLYADKRKPSLKQWIREQNQPTLSEEQIARLETAVKIT